MSVAFQSRQNMGMARSAQQQGLQSPQHIISRWQYKRRKSLTVLFRRNGKSVRSKAVIHSQVGMHDREEVRRPPAQAAFLWSGPLSAQAHHEKPAMLSSQHPQKAQLLSFFPLACSDSTNI